MIAVALTWLCVAFGLVTKTVEAASNLPTPLVFLPFLGSGFVPTESMPTAVQWFADYQPFTPIMETVRGLLLGIGIGNNGWLGDIYFTCFRSSTVIVILVQLVKVSRRGESRCARKDKSLSSFVVILDYDELTILDWHKQFCLVIECHVELVCGPGLAHVLCDRGRKCWTNIQTLLTNWTGAQPGHERCVSHLACVFTQICRRRLQTSGTARSWRAFGRKGEILGSERRVGFEAHDAAAVAEVESGSFSIADRAALQAVVVEVDQREVLAVAAVLPLKLEGLSFAGEIELAEHVPTILTLDGALAGGEKASLVFGTEYSHGRSSK